MDPVDAVKALGDQGRQLQRFSNRMICYSPRDKIRKGPRQRTRVDLPLLAAREASPTNKMEQSGPMVAGLLRRRVPQRKCGIAKLDLRPHRGQIHDRRPKKSRQP